VRTSTHDLYVANTGAHNVLVFHRGELRAYNTYTDPTLQIPGDVTVAGDGTIIASNIINVRNHEGGSLSTWIGGANGGTFVGNFRMINSKSGGFVTVQKNGTVYYNDVENTDTGALWSLSCPAGACGVQTQVAGVRFGYPGGMGSDASDDLLANDRGDATADTFELPNPVPSTFSLQHGGRPPEPAGMAINALDRHWFVADLNTNDALEYTYPGGRLIGKVPGNPDGAAIGIAVDPGHAR
jgi:hypothetical protein